MLQGKDFVTAASRNVMKYLTFDGFRTLLGRQQIWTDVGCHLVCHVVFSVSNLAGCLHVARLEMVDDLQSRLEG